MGLTLCIVTQQGLKILLLIVPLLILLHSLGIICVRKTFLACNNSVAARCRA